MIKTVSETVQMTKTTKTSFPVWVGFCEGQQVRFNKENHRFEVKMGQEYEWEGLTWDDDWLGTVAVTDIRDTLVNLLALLDATVPPKKKSRKKA